MLSKRDGDELLKGLGGPDTDWEEALVAQGLDAAAAAAIAGTTREDVLQRLLDLLRASSTERGETGDLARQLREDLQVAEAEIRRLEAEGTALADERQQQALATLSEKSGRAEQNVKHSQELGALRHALQQATGETQAKDDALRELRMEITQRESTIAELSASHAALEQQASAAGPAVEEFEARAAELSTRAAENEARAAEQESLAAEHEARAAELDARVSALRADLEAERALSNEKAGALAALRAEADAKLDKLRREQADVLAAARAQHASELASLRRQQEDAQSDQTSAQYAALKKASEDRWARMQQTQDDSRRQVEAKLAVQQARQAEELEQVRKEQAAAIESIEAKAWAEKAQAMVALKNEWEQKVERLRRENAQIVELLNSEHGQEIAGLQHAHEQALAIREHEHEEALKRTSQAVASQESGNVFAKLEGLREQIEKQYRTQLDELAARDHEALDEAAREHRAAMQALAERMEGEKAQALAEQKAHADSELARVREEQSVGADELAVGEGAERAGWEADRAAWDAERGHLLTEQSNAIEEKTQLAAERTRFADELAAVHGRLARSREEHALELDQVHEAHRQELEALQETHAQELTARPVAAAAGDELPTTSIRLDRLKSELIREHLAEIDDVKAAHAEELKKVVQEQIATRSAVEAQLREERERAKAAEDRAQAVEALAEEKVEKLRRANGQLTAALDEQEQRLTAAARGASLPPPRNPRSTIPPPVGSTTLSGIAGRDLERPGLRLPKSTIPPIAAAPPIAAPREVPVVRDTPREPVAPLSLGGGREANLGGGGARRASSRSGLPPVPLIAAGGAVVLAIGLAIGGFWLSHRSPKPEAPSETTATAAPPAEAAAPATSAPVTAAPMSLADFTSVPSGADVTIAGMAVGQTPLLNHDVRAGAHPVTISKAGYEKWSGSVVVEAGKKATVVAELRPIGAAAVAPVEAGDNREYFENELDSAPKPTAGAPVAFPQGEVAAQKPGSTVSVTVSFLIGLDGSVSRVEIVQSGGKALDVAALSAIGKWKFSPGMKKGVPVKVKMTRKFSFKF